MMTMKRLEQYLSLIHILQNGSLYKKANPITWKCENCGYEFSGSEVPPQCPVCQHPAGFFNTPIGK